LGKGKVILNRAAERLEQIHPADLADYLERTNILNINKIVTLLDEDFAAEVIGNLNINYQTALFRGLKEARAARVINLIDPDEAVDILLTLSPRRRSLIIESLPPDKKIEMQYLLNLSKTPIGGHITSEFLTVSPEDRVRQVIEKIKKETGDFSFLNYIYVLNNNQLVGVFNLHELIMQGLNNLVYKFMIQNVITIHLTTPEEIALKKMFKYRIHALPVVDRQNHILGIVTYDQIATFALAKL
jgi:Mg/Co/Ni transporter MgtE